MATFAFPSAASSAASTRSGVSPVAVSTILRTRARSFSFVAATSTMRLPNVFPSRIIAIVEIMLRTSFCAVPALSRVEPAMNSGPTTTATSCSARRPSSEPSTETTPTARAPAARAASRAPRTYGVRPLALTPTTASSGVMPRAPASCAPASASSSAASWTSGGEAMPPATSATTCPGGVEKVDSHSAASSAASRPDEPAPT